MSKWLQLTIPGNEKRRCLARLDSIQFIEEGYTGKIRIGFAGEEGLFGFEESFDDVYDTIKGLWREDERIYKVAKES